MIDPKNPFAYKQPKVFVTQTTLGPHREKVFELAKEIKPVSYARPIWVVASLLVGFLFSGYVFQFGEHSLEVAKSMFKEQAIIVVDNSTEEDRLLGSDDVFEEDKPEDVSFTLSTNKTIPKTAGLSFLVADIETGKTIIEKNSDMILPIASVSKLMTAIVAKETLDLHETITVSRSSVDTYGTSGGLISGEKILVTDLLYPLLIESSNDAAEVFAFAKNRFEFISKLNSKAKELGMNFTFFEDPSGLSANNVSTAKDLFLLASFIHKNYREIWDITRVKEHAILKHKWQNGNNQLKKSYFIGGKNGFTDEALRTTLSVFEIPFSVEGVKEKQKRIVAVVVLKSPDRDGDIDKLLRYTETSVSILPEKVISEEI